MRVKLATGLGPSGLPTAKFTTPCGSQGGTIGNFQSMRAMISYEKHIERQTAKLVRKYEIE